MLKRIRLELARMPGFPEGASDCGYDFVAPLDVEGHLDAAAWKEHRERCSVKRFWRGERPETGHLVHKRDRWLFSYKDGDEDDEPIFRFDRHVIRPGEYLSITEHDGETRTFRVASVK